MGLAVIVGLLFGLWLDGKLGTSPIMLIVFLCVGFAAGIKGVLREAARADRIAAASVARDAAEARAAEVTR